MPPGTVPQSATSKPASEAGGMWRIVRDAVGGGRLSVVMPVYNLAATIEENLKRTAELFEAHGVRAELVPVDDGSADGTWSAIEAAASGIAGEFVTCVPVHLSENGGKGAALRAGFAASHGEYVMLLDGDLDINPKQTPWFFASLAENGSDIVIGSKRHPKSKVQYPWHRRIVSWVYFTLVRIFIGLPITDTQTGMKLFRRNALEEALSRMLVKTYAFDLELLAIAHSRGAKISEAPVAISFGSKFGALRPSTVRSMAHDTLAVFYRLKLLKYYASIDVPKAGGGERPFVSVIVACPERTWMLDECLKSLERQTYRDFEVIVLPDGEWGTGNGERGKAQVVSTGKVRPAEKRNMGAAHAKGEILAFIDDDAYADPRWLEHAVGYFADGSIGAVGGPGVTPPDDAYFAQLGGKVYENVFVSGSYRYRYSAGGICRDVDDLPCCNLLVRKSLFDSIGGYRTDFWPGEDTLLCKDIRDSGSRIKYDPRVVVRHHRRPLFLPHLRQLGRYAFHRGYFCRRFPSNSLHLAYFVPSLFVVYLATAWVAWAALNVVPAMPAELYVLLAAYVSIPSLLYAALVAVSSFSLNPVSWVLVASGVFISHIVYGAEFLYGLLARRAPCEFIGKDHARQ